MKQIFVLLFLLISLSLQGGDLNVDKKTLIENSSYHYQEAISELKKAQGMCWYIPDFHKRENIHSLIGGTIGAALAKDPRTAILLIGLPLLANALSNMQEKYMEMMDCFAKAEKHFEMAKIYNNLSIKRHFILAPTKELKFFFKE